MLHEITGLHHMTSLASDAAQNNAFFANTLGLRRVKRTVDFDAPQTYHLHFDGAVGTPGSATTQFALRPDRETGRQFYRTRRTHKDKMA